MINVFFSYTHKDEHLRDELEIHLSSLKRQGIIDTWHDRRIDFGEEIDATVSENLKNANIILLLVSPYFLASDYCYDIEMRTALDMHNNGNAIVMPVILHPCDWHDMPFGKLLACPTDGKPVSKFPNQHDAFLEVVKAVKSNARRILPVSLESDSQSQSPTRPARTQQFHRSSNLRIKKQFSDHDKDTFITDSLEYMANFFEKSLEELEKRSPEIKTAFRRIDANTFKSSIYQHGQETNSCYVKLNDKNSLSSGIVYGQDESGSSYQESLAVEDNGYSLYLKPWGLSSHMQDRGEELSYEGAAELYWGMLISHLQ